MSTLDAHEAKQIICDQFYNGQTKSRIKKPCDTICVGQTKQ